MTPGVEGTGHSRLQCSGCLRACNGSPAWVACNARASSQQFKHLNFLLPQMACGPEEGSAGLCARGLSPLLTPLKPR